MAASFEGNTGKRGGWLRSQRRPGEAPPEMRLFCFPPAGSVCAPFATLERVADKWAECVTVQLPGRGPRINEQPVQTFEELTEEAASVISAAVAGSPIPYMLLGQSMGGIAAYEVATLLDWPGLTPPFRVVVASSNAPQEVARQANSAEPFDPLRFLRHVGAPDELFASQELLELTVRALYADWRLLRSYRFSGRVLDVPLSVFYGSGDDQIDRRSIAAWTRHSTAGAVIREFAGGHRFPDVFYGELLGELRQEAAAWPR
jgi:medium-chain acyl-[acyl-carrier-protein] hydrolase